MAPEFQVYKDKRGEYRWRMVSSNGRIIAVSSDGFAGKADAIQAIRAVQSHDFADTEVYTDRSGGLRWRQKGDNGRVIAAAGESFSRREDCKYCIGLVYSLAPQTPINDLTALVETEGPTFA